MTVEKVPVSILQEMMAKMGSTPIYELCPSEFNNSSPIFTFKVTCDGIAAYGSGKSKKDAKQKAAQTMIEKLAQRKVVVESSSSSSALTQDNRVQELMNLCNKLHLEEPSYKELETTGPPHARIYTTLCIVSKFQQEGFGRTKKQSKQNAAKNMIDQLNNTFSIVSSQDENYNKRIKKVDTDSNGNNRDFPQINTIHEASKLKINYQLKLQSERKELLKTLEANSSDLLLNIEKLSNLINECRLNCNNQNITKLKQMFQNVMDTAKIDFHHMLLQTADPATFMLIIQLNIVPDVIEMSIGKTREEAEWRTISKIVGCLKELLN